MKTSRYEENKQRLEQILSCKTFDIGKHIDDFEQTAINIGDLERAGKYRILKNNYKEWQLSDDDVFYKILVINSDTSTEEKS